MFDNNPLPEYLERKELWYRIVEKESTVHTADAASKTGIPLERITKSLVCLVNGNKPIVCIIPGNRRLNFKKVRKLVNGKVELCPFKEAHKYSGYDPGATPPCCYENIEQVIVDKEVLDMETTFGGGGTNKSLLEIKPKDIIELNEALVEDIT